MKITEQCRELANRVSMKTATKVTFGYIGNLDHRYGDDRSWMFFTNIPIRNAIWASQTHSFGGCKTEKIEDLFEEAEEKLLDYVNKWLAINDS
jgi:hypothetical protein